jgi:GNAT superfamily N-acetyltransferase
VKKAPDPQLRSLLYLNDISAARRIYQITVASRRAHVAPWLLLDGGHEGLPAFRRAVSDGTPLGRGDLAVARMWYSSLPFRVRLRDDEDRALLVAALQCGHEVRQSETAFHRPMGQFPPTRGRRLAVGEVTTRSELEAYGRLGWAEAGFPAVGAAIARTARRLGFALLLGSVGNTIVGCSMAVLSGEVVGVYNVFVEPRFRGNGFGSRLTVEALRIGRRHGAVRAYLSASDSLAGLYRKLGFAPLFRYVTLEIGFDSEVGQ